MRAVRDGAGAERAGRRSARTSARSASSARRRWSTCARTAAASWWRGRGGSASDEPRRRGTSISTCRSARTAAATATSSPRSDGRTSTGRTSTRCSPSSSWSVAVLAPRLETIFLGGGTPTFTEPAALERLLAGAAGRGRGHGRGESGDGDARAGPASVTKPCQSCVAGRAELPAAPSRRAGAARAARGRPPRRATFSVMPDLTTSRSISSTASRARAPPTSTPTSPRRSRSSPSTCPATSWRPSRARASPTRTEPSSSARPSRWSPTSSGWSPR